MGLSETSNTLPVVPKETLAAFGGNDLRARVFWEKYSFRKDDGVPTEVLPEEMWRRVSKAIASVETNAKQDEWEKNFYWLLENYRFIPGGRILFGAGQTNRKATLLNCYFVGYPEDNIEGIFGKAREMARTYSFGGGCGVDISTLRPKGALVSNSAVFSTGAVSFMDLFSATTGIIGQAGRRGALMITIENDHPDLLDFINVKRDLKKVNYANISIKIKDEFMRAVEENGRYTLKFNGNREVIETDISARDAWKQIIRGAWESAEPGIVFWDTSKRESTTEYNNMNIGGLNPCAEITLEPYGCCCLGSVNLSAFVVNPFTENANIDWEDLIKTAAIGTRFLDDVLSYNADKHPLPQQKIASLWSRRIGVSFTGLGDMLVKLGLKYDEDGTIEFVSNMFEKIKNAVYKTSIDLAVEKGSFPGFDADKHLAQDFIKRLNLELQARIKKDGLRNAALMAVAPVGSGSILAGCSSGIEPIFALRYTRRSESLSQGEFEVVHPLVQEYRKIAGDNVDLPSYFVTAHDIRPEFRVKMQGAIQKQVDHAISSTINLPQNTSVDTVERIYMLAWKSGLKGVTIYREGSRAGILETDNVKKEVEKAFERPKTLAGKTTEVKVAEGTLYVTLNTADGAPKEVFINLGKSGTSEKADTEAIGRLISIFLQHNGTLEEVIGKIKGINAGTISWDDGDKIMSIPDGIARALEILADKTVSYTVSQRQNNCPKCKENTLVFEGGCYTCSSCGYSKCG